MTNKETLALAIAGVRFQHPFSTPCTKKGILDLMEVSRRFGQGHAPHQREGRRWRSPFEQALDGIPCLRKAKR